MSSKNTSITAFCVACSLQKLAALPTWRSHFSADQMALNEAWISHGADHTLKRMMRALPSALFPHVMDFVFIPGMAQHFLFRKKLVEEEVMQSLLEGAQQVIILGGGLDTLALRLSKRYPEVPFIEMDLPATQQAKLAMLDKIDYPVPANCLFQPVDLANTSLKDACAQIAGFNPAARTIVVLEGVLMYLAEREVRELFAAMHRLFSGELSVVFGAIAKPDSEANLLVRLTNALLTKKNEGTYWFCPSSQMPAMMASLGYEIIRWSSYKKLQRQHRKESDIARVPEEDENYYIVRKSVANMVQTP